MRVAIEEVRASGKIAEAAICYTGDILDPTRTKYTLSYYVKLAEELEKCGANILAIKDMAGLLKPYAAKQLIKALRDHVGHSDSPAYTRHERQRDCHPAGRCGSRCGHRRCGHQFTGRTDVAAKLERVCGGTARIW